MIKTEFNLLKVNAEKNYLYLPFNINKKIIEILLKHEVKQSHLPLLDVVFTKSNSNTCEIKIYYNDLLIEVIPYYCNKLTNMTNNDFKKQVTHNFNIIISQLVKGGYIS